MSVVIVGKHTGLQFFALLNLNKANIIFYGLMQPHSIKERKWLEFFNEIIVMFLSYSMLCMTSFLLDDMVVFQMGYVFLALFGILVAGNLLYIFNLLHEKYQR